MNAPATQACTSDELITRSGRVVAVEGAQAQVRFEQESACSACRAAKVCAGNSPTRDIVVAIDAGRALSIGDRVEVGVSAATALRATAIAYTTPLAGLLVGMMAGTVSGLPEPAVVFISLAGLAIGFATMGRFARRPGNRLTPVLLDSSTPKAPKENQA